MLENEDLTREGDIVKRQARARELKTKLTKVAGFIRAGKAEAAANFLDGMVRDCEEADRYFDTLRPPAPKRYL